MTCRLGEFREHRRSEGSGLLKWTRYDPAAEPYLELGDTIQLKNHLLKMQLDFLEACSSDAGRRSNSPREQ
jgi:hypothetical protein